MGIIKKKLIEMLQQDNLILIFSILETCTSNEDIYLLKAQFSSIEIDDSLGAISFENKKLEINKIRKSLLSFFPEEDFEVLKYYLEKLQSKVEWNRILNLLLKSHKNYSHWLTEDLDALNPVTISHIENTINSIHISQLLINWEETLCEDLFSYVPFYELNTIAFNPPHTNDIYLDSIVELSQKPKVKREGFDLFFIWSEQYATNDFEKAYETSLLLRSSHTRGYPSYEYLFLSYAKKCCIDVDEREQEKWLFPTSQSYKNLVVYLQYSNILYKESPTLVASKGTIGNLLLDELESCFDRINHDYVTRNTTKNSEKKREDILKIFNAYTAIIYDFEVKSLHRVFEKILIELLGGGNFRWVHLESIGPTNLTDFDAVSFCDKSGDLLRQSEYSIILRVINTLKANFRYKISSLSITKNRQNKKYQIFNACCFADYFFPNSNFMELVKNLSDDKKEINEDSEVAEMQEIISVKKAINFDYTNEKVKNLISRSNDTLILLSEEAIPDLSEKELNSPGNNVKSDFKDESLFSDEDGNNAFKESDYYHDLEGVKTEQPATLPFHKRAKFSFIDILKLTIIAASFISIIYLYKDKTNIFLNLFFVGLIIFSSLAENKPKV